MTKTNKNEDIEDYIIYSDKYIEDYDLNIYCTNDCKFYYDECLKINVFDENQNFKIDFKAINKNELKGGIHLIYTKNINTIQLYEILISKDFKKLFEEKQKERLEQSKNTSSPKKSATFSKNMCYEIIRELDIINKCKFNKINEREQFLTLQLNKNELYKIKIKSKHNEIIEIKKSNYKYQEFINIIHSILNIIPNIKSITLYFGNYKIKTSDINIIVKLFD
jgi:hypothetical protein